MSKLSFFTPNDYLVKFKRTVLLLRDYPGISLGAGGLILASGAWALAAPGLGGPWNLEGWWALLLLPALVGGFGTAAWACLAVRRSVGDGAPVTWTAWRDLLADWGGLTVRAALWSVVALVPVWIPAVAAGVADGWSGAASTGGPRPDLAARALTSGLCSLVGWVYLWSYPALVFFGEVRTAEVQKWAWTLSVRTWPLAAGWAALTLVALAWEPGSRGADLWSTFLSTLQVAFVTAQLLVLAEASKRPGFGP